MMLNLRGILRVYRDTRAPLSPILHMARTASRPFAALDSFGVHRDLSTTHNPMHTLQSYPAASSLPNVCVPASMTNVGSFQFKRSPRHVVGNMPARTFAKKKRAEHTGPDALDKAIKHIENSFGQGAVMRLGKKAADSPPVEVYSTGSLTLDLALGIGGLPKGRIVEIFGTESSGKTTLALHCISEAQKAGGKCVFIDAEHALDASYAQKLGVDLDDLLVAQPDSGEQALEIADTLTRTGDINLIVVDSVAALTPRAELEGEMGDHHIGLQARLMSQALRKLTASVGSTNTIIIFINQIRQKVGVMFGSPETTSGGLALRFYSSVRLEVRRTGSLKKGDEIVANHVRVKVAKNKLAPPFRQAEFDINFGTGISKLGEITDLGTRFGIIKKAGAWYSYGDVPLGQGREKVATFLRSNPQVCSEIEEAIRDAAKEVDTPIELGNDEEDLADVADELETDPVGSEDDSPEALASKTKADGKKKG